MANNKVNLNNDILVKVDHNNLIYIDPNSVVSNGMAESRGNEAEKLVTYVNLEADLIPRTVLNSENNNTNILTIAKGNFNLLQNKSGKNFDTSWTEAYVATSQNGTDGDGNLITKQDDQSTQSFGIESINITTAGANFIPTIQITFIDVRGKTLFESPKNSPYNAFMHLPWPIFYLTIKGYYGKAIKYRLHLVSFNTRFNPNNGNFEIDTKFVGSTYAYLNDIPLEGILNAPYIFSTESDEKATYNRKTGNYEKKIKKTTRGYRILKNVYQEYINNGSLPKGFPFKTLREVIIIAGRLNKILEKQLFSSKGIDPGILSGAKEFDTKISDLEGIVKLWRTKNLTPEYYANPEGSKTLFYVLRENKKSTEAITSTDGKKTDTLEYKINAVLTELDKNKTFGKQRDAKSIKKFSNRLTQISTDKLKTIKRFISYGKMSNGTRVNDIIGVDIDGILNEIYEIRKNYNGQQKILEEDIETRINQIVKDPKNGIGFEPTIRNIIGVILANADTYIRLMRDVHERAYDVSKERVGLLSGVETDIKDKNVIYPWPEVKTQSADGKQSVLVYPGSTEMIGKLKSDDKRLWPEIDFLENFYQMSTKKLDPISGDEMDASNIVYIFDNEISKNKKDISTFDYLTNDITPYINKSMSSIFYEIYERIKYSSSLLPQLSTGLILTEMANVEFNNLKTQIQDDDDIITMLKSSLNGGVSDLKSFMAGMSPYEKYPYYQDQLPTTSYIKNSINQDFKVEKYLISSGKTTEDIYKQFNDGLTKNYNVEDYRLNLYPFNSTTYKTYLPTKTYDQNTLKLNQFLQVNNLDGFICSPVDDFINNHGSFQQWVKSGYTENLFTNLIKINGVGKNILNTPYFHKQLYTDFLENNIEGKYTGSAYLLLNSLPFVDLDDKITNKDGKQVLVSTLLKEVGATHFIPYHLMLKWGSIYHRYKKNINEGIDIISGVTTPINYNLFFDNLSGRTYRTINDPSLIKDSFQWVTNGSFYENGTEICNLPYSGTTGVTNYYTTTNRPQTGDYLYIDTNMTPLTGTTKWKQISNLDDSVRFAIKLDADGRISELEVCHWVTPPFVVTQDTTQHAGLTPFYQTIYHQVVNQYGFYNPSGPTSIYTDLITNNKLKVSYTNDLFGVKNWTAFVDNSKYDVTSTGYTLLPCNGFVYNNYIDPNENYKVIWSTKYNEPSLFPIVYSGQTFPLYDEYNKDINNTYSLSQVNKKVVDLIAVFKPEILDVFEQAFLDFSSEKLNENVVYKLYDVKYDKFQDLLKSISYVSKDHDDPAEINNLITSIINKQNLNLLTITNDMLSYGNLIKLTISNPREFNHNVYGDFTKFNVENHTLGHFNSSQVTPETLKLIELYLGSNLDGHEYYLDFFDFMNIELNESNVKQLRPIIYLYSGLIENGITLDRPTFNEYIINNVIIPINDFENKILSMLVSKITSKDLEVKNTEQTTTISRGYNDDPIKLELYDFFKSFNDKWTSGNSIGQRTLIEEFLFLDKANKDIGDLVFVDMQRLIGLTDTKNKKASLFSTIAMIIEGSNFDLRALPSYVNFYGTNFNNNKKLVPSKTVAKNIFGTFLEVDHEESSPKIILQYMGPSSKYPDMENSKDYLYDNDGFDISNVNKNPIIIAPEIFRNTDFSKSNKAVAFEVSIGDQNQSIFKSVELDQATIKNTSESFAVLERLGQNETGSSTAQVDVGLFDIWRQASYQCTVTSMGNMMIQPTMYFYLKNIPMFKGTYWITEVKHNITTRGITTTFKGSRIPFKSLPNPKDSFYASYKALFNRMVSQAKVINQESQTGTSENVKTYTYDGVDYSYVYDTPIKSGEEIIQEPGITEFGIPFNGYNNEKHIQLVKTNNPESTEKEWLRTKVISMSSISGYTDNTSMNIVTRLKDDNITGGRVNLTWNDVKHNNQNYYASNFSLNNVSADNIITKFKTTKFFNPNNNKSFTLNTTMNSTTGTYEGPVVAGIKSVGYGLALSDALMTKLLVSPGDIIYFMLKN